MFSECSCQSRADRRWSLLPDSSVIVPLADLRLAAGYRLGQDRRVSNAVQQIAALAGEVNALENSLKSKTAEAVTLRAINDSYNESLGKSQQDATKYEAQAKRRGRTIWTLAVLFVGSVTLHLAR